MTPERRHEQFQNYMGLVDAAAKRFPTLHQDDLKQLGYVRLLKLINLKGEEITGGLVKTAMKNLFIDELRAEMKAPKLVIEEGDELEPPADLADNQFIQVETLMDMERTFYKYLSRQESELMLLRWADGCTTPEVAKKLDLNVKGVQRIESAALTKLAQMTEDPLPDLHQYLWQILLFVAVTEAPHQVARFARMVGADPEVMLKTSAPQAKKRCVALRKQGY